MQRRITKWILAFWILALGGLVSCGNAGLGVAALLGGGSSGAGGQSGFGGEFADASTSALEDEEAVADEDATDAGDAGVVTATTYYIDEDGNMVETTVDAGGDSIAADAGEFDVDGDSESSGSQTGTGDAGATNGMTDEAAEYGETGLDPIEVATLPVTLPKDGDDDDDGDGNPDCSSDTSGSVTLSYGEGDTHYMMMPEEDEDDGSSERSRSSHASSSRSKKSAVPHGTKNQLLNQTSRAAPSSAASAVRGEIVFFPSPAILSDDEVEVTPVTCGVEPEPEGVEVGVDVAPREVASGYAWQSMNGDSVSGYEVETGTFHFNAAGEMILSEKATVTTFTGASAKFTVDRADFGLTTSHIGDEIPYLIMRPIGR